MGYNHRLVLEFLLHAYDFTGAAAEERQEISPTLRAEERKRCLLTGDRWTDRLSAWL
jgi:hypothetical protein